MNLVNRVPVKRIGWNDITTIRINKSKVILGKHIKTSIYRKIIGAETNWLNTKKTTTTTTTKSPSHPLMAAASTVAILLQPKQMFSHNSKLHLSMTFSVEFDSLFPVMVVPLLLPLPCNKVARNFRTFFFSLSFSAVFSFYSFVSILESLLFLVYFTVVFPFYAIAQGAWEKNNKIDRLLCFEQRWNTMKWT